MGEDRCLAVPGDPSERVDGSERASKTQPMMALRYD
jgi:hypothetical protein